MTDAEQVSNLLSPRGKHITTEANKVVESLNLQYGFALPPTGKGLRTPAKTNNSLQYRCSELIWTLGSNSLEVLQEIVGEFSTDISLPKQHSQGPLGELHERLRAAVTVQTQGRKLFTMNSTKKTRHTPKKQPSLPSITSYLVQQPKRRSGNFDQDDKIGFNENTDPRKRSCTSSAETVELMSSGNSTKLQRSFLPTTATTSFDSEFPQATQYSWGDETSSQQEKYLSFGAATDLTESVSVTKPANRASTTEKTIDYRLRDLHKNPLSNFKLPPILSDVPIGFRWAIFTAITESKLDINQLNVKPPKRSSHHAKTSRLRLEQIADWLQGCPVVAENRPRDDLIRHLSEDSHFQLKARLTFDPHGVNLLNLSSPRFDEDASCRLQRKFGSSRLMYVEYTEPSSNDCTSLNTTRSEFKNTFFSRWLMAELDFLGCRWRCFHVEEKEKENGSYRLIFFAISGIGLKSIHLRSFFDDFLPLNLNLEQLFAKAYARIALSLSSTKPTVTFRHSQIRRVRDILADGSPEATCFDDPRCTFPKYHDAADPHVMSDGCAKISPAAWKAVCEHLGIQGDRPVALQCRLGGAKGMWMLSSLSGREKDDGEIWIEISDSQLKYNTEPGDIELEVIKHPTALKPSSLFMDFMPILQDRGVPSEVLVTVAEQQVVRDFQAVFAAIDDPILLRRWIARTFGGDESRNRESGIRHSGGTPRDMLERTIGLLETGFIPKECPVLAEFFQDIVKSWALEAAQKLKIRLPKSAYAYGVPDFDGVLAPGEIYIATSVPFEDDEAGEFRSCLQGDVLVARHPTLRNSDIQRVRALYKQELSHYRDVVIFSTRGEFPLAGKLQGGDYDGDQFWVTWDNRLVEPFRNAPVPTACPTPESLGIKVDRRTLREVLGPDGRDIDYWLRESFKLSMQGSVLGHITKYLHRLAYLSGNITDGRVTETCDLHDLVIDSAKNGYIFGQDSWNKFKRRPGRPSSVPDPPYERFRKETPTKLRTLIEGTSYKRTDARNVVCFKVVGPEYLSLLQNVRTKLVASKLTDAALEQHWEDAQAQANTRVLNRVLVDLKEDIRHLIDHYSKEMTKCSSRDGDQLDGQLYAAAMLECSEIFQQIQPRVSHNEDNEVVKA